MFQSLGKHGLIAVLLFTVTLAGCAEQGVTESPDGVDVEKEVQATSTTGGIRGVVVDESITPIPDVTVTLQGQDKQTVTDAGGEFVFSGLDPGVYFVQTQHPLYETIQQAATVEAGVSDPKAVRLQLVRNTVQDPFLSTLSFNGYIVCSTNLSGIGYSEECGEGVGYPCLLPPTVYECGDRIGRQDGSTPQIWFNPDQPGAASIIVEQAWTPSLSLATGNTAAFRTHLALDWICDPFCGGDRIVATVQESPLYLRADSEQLGERDIGPDSDLSTFVYSGSDNGVILEQKYEQYVTFSFGLAPPEGWSFINQDPYPF